MRRAGACTVQRYILPVEIGQTAEEQMDKKTKKKQKGSIKEALRIQSEWLYLSEREGILRHFYEYLRETGREAQFWEEAGVLELSLAEDSSMDMEVLEKDQWDEELCLFIKQRTVNEIYTINFPEKDQKAAHALMEELAGKAGGSFCKDTEDFLPEIKER